MEKLQYCIVLYIGLLSVYNFMRDKEVETRFDAIELSRQQGKKLKNFSLNKVGICVFFYFVYYQF